MEDPVKKAVLAAFLGAGISVMGSVPMLAHHSSAAYDRDSDVELAGTIKEFQYTNPHSWLMVEVVDKTGKTVDWGFEAEGPSTLLRAGIKISSLKPGEKITVKGHPLRDGRPAAILVSVTKADGSVLSTTAALRRGPGGKPVETPSSL
ncbi:MAG: hypothetical protein DMF92_07055 [Acidobacteria bacterium]|nr:MAG: hypothetical protein DMF92_07055 [Acidobacteriota bacterium]